MSRHASDWLLLDTAGQEKFRSITRSYYRNSAGVLLVYDITSRESFEHVVSWLREARENLGGPNPDKCAFILIGHKADMEQERQARGTVFIQLVIGGPPRRRRVFC